MMNNTNKSILKEKIETDVLTIDELDKLAQLVGIMHPQSTEQLNLRDHSKEYYHWIYFRNPVGNAIVYRASYEGNIIGTFAIVPKRMQIGNHILICGKTMDMFTHPEFQGLGLMSQLALRVFEAAKNAGIHLWYVTPSKNSYPIFKDKWRYIESFEITYLIKIFKWGSLLSTMINKGQALGKWCDRACSLFQFNKKAHSNFQITTLETFGAETDELWQCRRSDEAVSLIRDSQYMNWRYIDNPDNYAIYQFRKNETIYGIIVLKYTIRRGMKVGEIVDYLCRNNDESILGTMVKFSLDTFKQDGCVLGQTWAIKDSVMERKYQQFGLPHRRNTLKFLLSPGSALSEFYDRERWFLTQGDGNDI